MIDCKDCDAYEERLMSELFNLALIDICNEQQGGCGSMYVLPGKLCDHCNNCIEDGSN